MGSFLIKEEEILNEEEHEKHEVSGIEDFIHSEKSGFINSNVKAISVSVAVLVTIITAFLIFFKSPSAPQPILIIPENTSLKETVLENKEKYEDKKIYNYLQNLDNEKSVNYHILKEESTVSKANRNKVMTNEDETDKETVVIKDKNVQDLSEDLPKGLTSQEKRSLEKIDDLIKSFVTKSQGGSQEGKKSQIDVADANSLKQKPLNNRSVGSFIEHSGGFYRVNLGIFETHHEAQALITKLHNHPAIGEYIKDIPYYIIAIDDEIGAVSYKVLLGSFKSKDLAGNLAKTIMSNVDADTL